MNFLKKIYFNYITKKRESYNKSLQKRLTNDNFSLITNNCDGGVIYHNLNKKFLSPTVNLFFPIDDYLFFCENLQEFLKGQLTEIANHDKNYPVGKLSCSKGEITLFFMHYKTFDDAKEKWVERAKRVNFENLYFIFEINENIPEEKIDRFFDLPYKNKVILSIGDDLNDNKRIYKVNANKKFVYGQMLKYKSKFSAKRWLDDFDYVSFINQK